MLRFRLKTYRFALLCLLASAGTVHAQSAPPAPAKASGDPAFVNRAFTGEQIRYESVNAGEPGGDKLGPARQLAAAIVAQDKPDPRKIVDVGSHAGEFLEAFLEQFPNAKGQWTEPVENNHANAIRRFARFGKRVDYVIGCPNRDISLGCVPKDVDVMVTAWLSIHQDLPGIRKFYREADAMLPSGGWIVNLDHVAFAGGKWGAWMNGARGTLKARGLVARSEGPGVHHPDWITPTLDDQIAAIKAAGFADVQVAWQRLDTVLIMARKP